MRYLILFISLLFGGCGGDSNTATNTTNSNNTASANCDVTECVKSQVRAMSCEAISSGGKLFDSNFQKMCYQQCPQSKYFRRLEMIEEIKQRCR